MKGSDLKNQRLKQNPAENSCNPLFSKRSILKAFYSTQMCSSLGQISRLIQVKKLKLDLLNLRQLRSRVSSKTTLPLSKISITICAKTGLKSIVSSIIQISNHFTLESSMKVFNTYVQFCSLAYWGPSGGPAAP